jgi:hypothetical protein
MKLYCSLGVVLVPCLKDVVISILPGFQGDYKVIEKKNGLEQSQTQN